MNLHDDSSDSDSDSSVQSVHSDDSQLSFEFNEENCQKRIDEFVEVTSTDIAVARRFLQDRKWSVVRAINGYFRELRKEAKNKRKIVQIEPSTNGDATDEKDAAVSLVMTLANLITN